MSNPQQPSVGRVVHYVSHGTPGGEYGKECRAAIVTGLAGDPNSPNKVALAVLNPTGMFFNESVDYHEGAETPGDASCPSASTHGSPFRYCACGWVEASLKGGSWHWPERV
jgi:hypothetical protein